MHSSIPNPISLESGEIPLTNGLRDIEGFWWYPGWAGTVLEKIYIPEQRDYHLLLPPFPHHTVLARI